ncbi:hypothetical protein [Nocardia sp. NPDC002869]|uniref:hypothetical protein n=1 Tax=Nocardia sp. NPDC002869 TaxID=3161032 RepID=UPI00398D025B
MEAIDRGGATEVAPGSLRQLPTLEATVGQLGSRVARESAVGGDAALQAVFPDRFPRPTNVDLFVSRGAFDHLQQQPEWSRVGESLVNGELRVKVGGQGTSYGDYAPRMWRTSEGPEGIQVIGLPDLTVGLHKAGTPEDLAKFLRVRETILDPSRPPLPDNVIRHELDLVRSHLPDHVLNHPDAPAATRLAGNALHGTNALYGHGDIGHILPHFGEKELVENGGAFSGYHNGAYLPKDMQSLQQHAELKGFPAADRALAMAADNYSDLNFGDGRGLDELRSAKLFRSHAEMLDYLPAQTDRGAEAILGTKFDESKRIQPGIGHEDPVARGVIGVDLQNTSDSEGYLRAVHLGPENLTSARVSDERPLGRTVSEHGLKIHTVEDTMEVMQEYRDYRPTVNGAPAARTLGEAMINHVENQVPFLDPKTPIGQGPADWSLRRPEVQQEHSDQAARAARSLREGQTFPDFYQEAKNHTEKVRERYGL